MEIVHTTTFQRLYEIKQLGWTDRIYPDACHSRFHHALGTVYHANEIITALVRNHSAADQSEWSTRLENLRPLIRMVALLHDVSHIPYGHTLEDELNLFPKRHDEDEQRKLKSLDLILAEIIYWNMERAYGLARQDHLDIFLGEKDLIANAESWWQLLSNDNHIWSIDPHAFIRTYAQACEVLLYMGGAGDLYKDGNVIVVWSDTPPLAHKLLGETELIFNLIEEPYICDIVGNTISADLLDYARRDSRFCGLRLDFDERVYEYFTLATVEEELKFKKIEAGEDDRIELQPTKRTRVAIDVRKGGIRYDALSEVVQILNIRYFLTERVYSHKTKCAASAMLGKAMTLLGRPEEEPGLAILQMGDGDLLRWLEDRASRQLGKNTTNDPPAMGALRLLRALRSRRFYKLVFHVRAFPEINPEEEDHPAKQMCDWGFRQHLEQEMEKELGLEPGNIIIYCPGKIPLKEAKCLMLHKRSNTPKPFNEIEEEGNLAPFVREVKEIERKYNRLWNLYIFLPERLLPLWPIVERLFPMKFEECCKAGGSESEAVTDEDYSVFDERLINDSDHRAYLKERIKQNEWGADLLDLLTKSLTDHWSEVLKQVRVLEQEIVRPTQGELFDSLTVYGARLRSRLRAAVQ